MFKIFNNLYNIGTNQYNKFLQEAISIKGRCSFAPYEPWRKNEATEFYIWDQWFLWLALVSFKWLPTIFKYSLFGWAS